MTFIQKEKYDEITKGIELVLKEKYIKYLSDNKEFKELENGKKTEKHVKNIEVKNIMKEVNEEIFSQEEIEKESDNDISDNNSDDNEKIIEKMILRSQKIKRQAKQKAITGEEIKHKASAPFIKSSVIQKQPIRNTMQRSHFNTKVKQMRKMNNGIGSFIMNGDRQNTRKPIEYKWKQIEFNNKNTKTEKKAFKIFKVSLEGFKARNNPLVNPSSNVKCKVTGHLDKIISDYNLSKMPIIHEKRYNSSLLNSWVTRIVRDRLIFMHNRVLVSDTKFSQQLKVKSFKSSMKSERIKAGFGVPEYSCEGIKVKGNKLDKKLQQSRKTHELRKSKIIIEGKLNDKAFIE